MRTFGIALLTVGALHLLAVNVPAVRRLKGMETQSLRAEYVKIVADLYYMEQTGTLPNGGLDKLHDMERSRPWIRLELMRRENKLDLWIAFLAVLGATLALNSFRNSRNRKKGSVSGKSPDDDVPDAIPREEYVDDWEFTRRCEGAFGTREEAVRWLLQDPLLKCDYCGAKLESTFESQREALELVTFYKKVPAGAKDMRIVMGSLWFAKPATELKCSGCQRVVRR